MRENEAAMTSGDKTARACVFMGLRVKGYVDLPQTSLTRGQYFYRYVAVTRL